MRLLLLLLFPALAFSGFNDWSEIAQSNTISPAVYAAGDITRQWVGPNKKPITLIVKQPVVSSPTVITINPTDGDARPVFEQAIARARFEKINRISISPGMYTFLSTDSTGQHLLFSKAKDLIFDGNGSKLVFTKNLNGLVIRQSQRVLIKNITLSYSLKSTSLGTIDGSKQLVIDGNSLITADNKIHQIAELDEAGHFVPGGVRIITPPGKELPYYVGNQSYTYPGFSKVTTGTRFLVIHQWYGGSAIKIDGDRDSLMTEDISFNNITINSTPGMAVAVTGLKRGFAFTNSSLEPDNTSNNSGGPSWDGIHISSGGGDVIIQNNRFSYLGDDAINISNPIHPIAQIVDNTLSLTTSSRFVAQGDMLAFFDTNGAHLGNAIVIQPPINKGSGKFDVTVDTTPPANAVYVRDINIMASRFLVSGNTIEDSNVHGLLAQIPNGLIDGNTFRRLGKNAIRLLSSIGPWNEGVGAFNVAVRNNLVQDGGLDSGYGVQWSAITIYGQRLDGQLSEHLFNEWIDISGNILTGLRQNCIGINNARRVSIGNNICEKL